MDLLASENSRRHLGRALDSLPDKIDETYDKAMLRVRGQEPVKTTCAFKVLSWVLFAQRPLKIEELRCALAIEENDSYPSEDALPDADSLLSACGGLIVVDDSEVVRFIHFTAQQYFNRASHSEFSSAHAYLATVCITYLSFSVFASGTCGDSSRKEFDRLQKRLKENVILGYAAEHWGDHVRECRDVDPAIHAMVRKFFTRNANVSCAIEASYHEVLSRTLRGALGRIPRDVTDLHIAAAFGLEELTEELLQQGACVDAYDSQRNTPLHNASTNGHINTIKCLLEKIAISESTDRHRFGAMKQAAVAGHEPATRFLLNTGASSYDIRDVIFEVAGEGHSDVLRTLLESLKDSRDRASCVGSAIIRASSSGHESSLRLLLEQGKGIEINDMQPYLNEALSQALEVYDPVFMQIMLESGADPDQLGYNGGIDFVETPLFRVARSQNIWAARYLLDRGADIEAVNAQGDRPIHQSLRSLPGDDGAFLKLLLDRGADFDHYGSNNETPLITVSRSGRTELLQHLLDHGADTLAKDKVFNRSSIEWAAVEGHTRVVRMLSTSQQSAETIQGLIALSELYQALDPDLATMRLGLPTLRAGKTDIEDGKTEYYNRLLSDINKLQPEDLHGLLLLHRPAGRGTETVLRAFIDMGADINALSFEGDMAIHVAAAHGHSNILEILLDHGAIIDRQDKSGQGISPLLHAIRSRSYDSIQLLVERGADIDCNSVWGTPLICAIDSLDSRVRGKDIERDSNCKDFICLLLDNGVDPNTETASSEGCTALHFAVRLSRQDVGIRFSRLLIKRGADLEAKNLYGETPLLLAVREALVNTVNFLLELGADPTTVEETTMPQNKWIKKSNFNTAMQLIKDAKLKWSEPPQSKSLNQSINTQRVLGRKRTLSMILN